LNRKARRLKERDQKIKRRREERKRQLTVTDRLRTSRLLREGVPCGNVSKRDIYKRDKGRCRICGGRVQYHLATLDHVVPLSKGGHHIKDNVQIAHFKCNRNKGVAVDYR
jgi:5-methylcytosine-specific restriction endonuclease McrA